MTDLSQAIVYDTEEFPNVFTLQAEMLHSPERQIWEISEYRDDRQSLFQWFDYLRFHQIPMIGFNNLAFDYPVIHFLFNNRNATPRQIYDKAMSLINSFDKFGNMIWQSDRFAPQVDLFKVNHFDNRAKTTSLKALQINMRSETVVDMPVSLNTRLTLGDVTTKLRPYGQHDTGETKRFAHFCMKAIQFRIGLLDTIKGDVLNFSDVKIGAKMLEQRIGEEVCYTPAYTDTCPFDNKTRIYHKKAMRQTVRSRIALNEIIFPYIYFNNPEFARVLTWMKQQVLTPEDLDDPDALVKTKGVFKGLTANVGGIEFYFGTGGIHGSVKPQRIIATDEWLTVDIDVEGFYPAIARVNRLAPAHLGDAYIREYAKIPIERKEWQERKGKKCVEANALKLAANGPWGQSNNAFTIFFDSQYAMTIPINGQLLLCMLADWLSTVPTLQMIQANTDGLTYRIHRDFEPQAIAIRKQWQDYTLLTLEPAQYKRMFIRDVNNYVAENMKGELKLKGAYWHPDPNNYAESISEAQPPAWHKDLGNIVSIRAANAAMLHGIDPETFIRLHSDKFDFMLKVKVDRASKLMLGDRQIQSTSRYYVAINGEPLRKISPPVAGATVGEYKRKRGITEMEYRTVLGEIGPNVWDGRIHQNNKNKYTERETGFVAGWKAAECNDANDFRFDNINWQYYVDEARKLII